MNTTADGSIYLTALDMTKWDGALTPGGLLSAASLDALWTPVRLNDGSTHPYGFGWTVGRRNGRRLVEHGGAWQGFVSHIYRLLDDGLTVAVFANRSGAQVSRIAIDVAGLIDPSATKR